MKHTVADTVSKVMHKRQSKVSGGLCLEEPPIVKNFAAEQMGVVKNLSFRPRWLGAPCAEAGTVYRRNPYEGQL